MIVSGVIKTEQGGSHGSSKDLLKSHGKGL